MSTPLSQGECRRRILYAARTGEAVQADHLRLKLCRTNAVGRTSQADSDVFDSVMDEMIGRGELQAAAGFVRASAQYRARRADGLTREFVRVDDAIDWARNSGDGTAVVAVRDMLTGGVVWAGRTRA